MPLQSQPEGQSESQLEAPTVPSPPARGVAPLWHTLVLVAILLAFSAWGASRSQGSGTEPMATLTRVRLAHYALTGFFELLLVGWVYLGLRLRKHSMSSLFGAIPRGLNNITQEIGVAALFWIISMSVLGTIGFTWNLVQNAQYQHEIATHPAEKSTLPSPQEQQVSAAKKLTSLAPANGVEVAAWGVLCLIVGFSEELIFRGYLQTQAALFLKRVPLGVLLSSLIFGAAHGYEGVRGIVLITVFGALFSAVTLLRRSLFPGMIAHAWHDFFTGMALAFIRESHMLDHLPKKL